MTKVVILNILGAGNWEQGFHVTLQLGEEGNAHSIQADGYLPANLEIPQYYQQWQYAYRRLPVLARINAPTQQETNVSRLEDCSDAAHGLRSRLNRWLDSEEFRLIKDKLLQCLNRDESIVILIQTEDIQLRRLPWHLWNFVQEYRQAEVVLSASNFEQVKTSASPQNALKILAILGNSKGINVERDREFLMNLPRIENPLFMVESPRQDITEQLWCGSWDILFFAGHSYTDCETGRISINATESLSLYDLRNGLRLAIQRGLKLAIFNSCDGLGLAKELQDLGIPQVIVMREPVPDQVAQNFLKYFLAEFSQGKSIYIAVRRARERLHDDGWELKIPGATWLPIICQNPATKPLVWPSGRKNIKFILIALIVALALIGGVSIFTVTLLKNIVEKNNIVENYPKQEQRLISKRYDEHGLEFNYPNDWEEKPLPIIRQGKIIQLIPKKDVNTTNHEIEISIIANSNIPMTLDKYVSQVQERLGPPIEEEVFILLKNRRKARKRIYIDSNSSTKVMEIVTQHGQTFYLIEYTAPIDLYDKFINDVNVILDSFVLKSRS